jgi:hypothetical protein
VILFSRCILLVFRAERVPPVTPVVATLYPHGKEIARQYWKILPVQKRGALSQCPWPVCPSYVPCSNLLWACQRKLLVLLVCGKLQHRQGRSFLSRRVLVGGVLSSFVLAFGPLWGYDRQVFLCRIASHVWVETRPCIRMFAPHRVFCAGIVGFSGHLCVGWGGLVIWGGPHDAGR